MSDPHQAPDSVLDATGADAPPAAAEQDAQDVDAERPAAVLVGDGWVEGWSDRQPVGPSSADEPPVPERQSAAAPDSTLGLLGAPLGGDEPALGGSRSNEPLRALLGEPPRPSEPFTVVDVAVQEGWLDTLGVEPAGAGVSFAAGALDSSSVDTALGPEPVTGDTDGARARQPEAGKGKPRGAPEARRATHRLTQPSPTTPYFNRELSWLKFNERVLEEALDPRTPLLERVRFLSIFANNLDEFFMVRVSGLRRQLRAGVVEPSPDGMSPAEQLAAIRVSIEPLLAVAHRCWSTDLHPKLAESGIRVLRYDELKKKQRKLLRRHFKAEIFPVLTPLAFDPGHPFPHISNLSLNLAIVARHPEHGERFARLKVPQAFPRLLRIPSEEKADEYERLGLAEISSPTFVLLEEVIAANLDLLFPGVDILAVHPFRVTRDADLDIQEDEASDLLEAMSEVVEQRHFGMAVRLELEESTPKRIRHVLVQNLRLAPYQIYREPSPLGLSALSQLAQIDRPELKYAPFLPVVAPALSGDENIFAALRRRDVLLYHPYDSFSPVVSFLREAADDPDVLAIKQTLYRTGADSPIVEALMRAREHGKQVSALIEIKARFDEENNMVWARALEGAGVHVVYGLVGLKTHAKLCLVVRRERKGICRYVHLATGNYNPSTARVYSDLGLFTCNPELADDVSDLFNALTGISAKNDYRKLIVAPGRMRAGILARIEREVAAHRKNGGGHIAIKVNSLTDVPVIDALYEASRAGVRIDLQVRGICCLRPGVEGLSETVTVTSVVGRFLEHSRILYFRNGGKEELLLGSADLMVRNLSRRVEVLFPVEDPELRTAVRDGVLLPHLRDTAKARRLLADGGYERVAPSDGESSFDSQRRLLEVGGPWRRAR